MPVGSAEQIKLSLTPSDCDHDFKFVAVCQLNRLELAARHDLPIALNCTAFASEIERVNQSAHAQGPGELPRLTIDREGNHASLR